MSSWGYTDNVAIAGTVSHYTQNVNVVGASTYFTVNVKDGDYLFLSGAKYQVANVTSNTALYLTSVAASNAASITAYLQQGPKFLGNLNGSYPTRNGNLATIQTVYGVTYEEMINQTVTSVAVANGGLDYLANVTANTTANVYTTGAVQPTSNATLSLTFTNNLLSAITVTNGGSGYSAAVQANTAVAIVTTGTRQPTYNAQGTATFTNATGKFGNADHTGWVTYTEYTDAFGNRRVKSETLAAMSKNFNAAAAGDQADDSIFAE
jgi:hypothetical protein